MSSVEVEGERERAEGRVLNRVCSISECLGGLAVQHLTSVWTFQSLIPQTELAMRGSNGIAKGP